MAAVDRLGDRAGLGERGHSIASTRSDGSHTQLPRRRWRGPARGRGCREVAVRGHHVQRTGNAGCSRTVAQCGGYYAPPSGPSISFVKDLGLVSSTPTRATGLRRRCNNVDVLHRLHSSQANSRNTARPGASTWRTPYVSGHQLTVLPPRGRRVGIRQTPSQSNACSVDRRDGVDSQWPCVQIAYGPLRLTDPPARPRRDGPRCSRTSSPAPG